MVISDETTAVSGGELHVDAGSRLLVDGVDASFAGPAWTVATPAPWPDNADDRTVAQPTALTVVGAAGTVTPSFIRAEIGITTPNGSPHGVHRRVKSCTPQTGQGLAN